MTDDTATAPERRRSKREALHELATTRYGQPRCTAKGEPYVAVNGVTFFLGARRREAVRGDLANAWRQHPGCEGEPPGRQLLDDEIAAMEATARHGERDELTSAEVVDGWIADGAVVHDEHPDRLKVHSSGRNPYDVAREVADWLLKANEPPRLFAMGPLAAVLLLDDGTLEGFDPDHWLAYVAERVDFLSRIKDGGDRIVGPPGPVMKIIPAVLLRELPQLDGVTRTPYLDGDGNLIASDGYNPVTRLMLRTDGLVVPPVSERPTPAEVAAAVTLLREDWLGDFPFARPADLANLVAELLTITGREMFPLAPMFVHDASTAGSGKGLLLLTISVIATGEPAEVMELPADGEEQRKTVTSVLMAGKLLVAWDELHVIQGKTLAAILTAEVYSGRILGANKLATVRNKLVQIALGNNVEVRGDLKRRVVPSRLVPEKPNPEHRDDFRHPDLKAWVRDNRGRLLAATYTLWRNWIATGRPMADVTLGSFELWARTIGGVLGAAGIEGFLSGTSEWLSFSEDDDGWSSHLSSFRRYFEDRWVTASMVADAVGAGFVKRPPVKRDPEKELASQIAYAYRGQRERRHGNGLRLIRSRGRDSENGAYTWSVRQDNEPDEDMHTHEPAAAGRPESSPASSVCPDPQVRDGDRPGDAAGNPAHLQAVPNHLQASPDGKPAGHGPFTGDAGHDGDDSGRFHAQLPAHTPQTQCPECDGAYDSQLHAVVCCGAEPPE